MVARHILAPMGPHGDPVEDQIRQAIERGEFDNLPGIGRRLDLGEDDPAWWVKRRIEEMRRRDELTEKSAAVAELEHELWALPTEDAVRAGVDTINRAIAAVNAELAAHDHLTRLDDRQAVATWRRMYRLRAPRHDAG